MSDAAQDGLTQAEQAKQALIQRIAKVLHQARLDGGQDDEAIAAKIVHEMGVIHVPEDQKPLTFGASALPANDPPPPDQAA